MRRAGSGRRARSSAGEHTLHTGGVRGSIPLAPTMIPGCRVRLPVGDVPAEAQMPEGLRSIERDKDPYAWALAQAALLRLGAVGLNSVDAAGLCEFLEEWAHEMLSTVRSQVVNLMAHAAKAATS